MRLCPVRQALLLHDETQLITPAIGSRKRGERRADTEARKPQQPSRRPAQRTIPVAP
ncbi:MAG TPA: hypothetical protein VKB72_05775 [Steroidobacteraceae bacterium]|nr:hypothetical protein [Steroidobacteraceae bacterium]